MAVLTGPRGNAEAERRRAAPPTASLARDVPLVVDLDGTLLHTDTLIESLFVLARTRPLQLFALPAWLAGGRARLKQRLCEQVDIDIATLPVAQDLLAYLHAQKRRGRRIVLATAADAGVAAAAARHFAVFDSVLASDGRSNLSASRKRDRLIAEFGAQGFDYIGDSRQDLAVWAAARDALLVRPSPRLAAAVARLTEVERSFGDGRAGVRSYLEAMRLSHWVKNLLLLAPLLAGHGLADPWLVTRAMLALLAFSFAASGIYLLNDLFDLPADRRHPHKRKRALASGRIPLLHALLLVPGLWSAAAVIAALLSPALLAVLAVYAALMIVYSMRLKDIAYVDAVVLGVGYSLRILAGALAVGVVVPAWLLVCSTMLFFGLALLKRYAELVTMASPLGRRGRVRGYGVEQMQRVAVVGIAASTLAIALLALVPLRDTRVAAGAIWLFCALLLVWTGHMWRMADRGRVHDDPVAFALRDRASRALAAAAAVTVLVAAA